MSINISKIAKAEQLSSVARILFVAAAHEWITPPYYFGPHTRLAIDFLQDTYSDVCTQFGQLEKRSKGRDSDLSSLAKPIVEISLCIGIIYNFQGGFFNGPITDELETKKLRKYFNQPNIMDLHNVWNTCRSEAPKRHMSPSWGIFPSIDNLDLEPLVKHHKSEHPTILYNEIVRITYNLDLP